MAFSPVSVFIPGDPFGQDKWLLEHYIEHQLFYTTLLGQATSVVTISMPIQRMRDPVAWLDTHNKVSQSVWTGIGGGQSLDLGSVDWNDSRELQDWLEYHAAWHQSVRDSLGL
jgi:hypothetical protein